MSKPKLINGMKLRDDEYKGFAIDLKHGKPASYTAPKASEAITEKDFRSEDYKGIIAR